MPGLRSTTPPAGIGNEATGSIDIIESAMTILCSETLAASGDDIRINSVACELRMVMNAPVDD